MGTPQQGAVTVLSRRALNRATLQRQLLLRRVELPAAAVIAHLVGLQGQDPDPPYIGLWNRIAGFGIPDLSRLLEDRTVVRATLFRATQHLLGAADYRWVRPLLQPMLQGRRRGDFGRVTPGVDPGELAAVGHALLGQGMMTRSQLSRALAERWPGRDAEALARSLQLLLPVVHPPPAGAWGRYGPTPFMLAEQWLGRPLEAGAAPGDLVLRYLAAFGPATVRDVQAWSGMTRLREVVDDLRPRLCGFRDDDGRELFDLPDAPRPDPDIPAPARFMAALDNLVLGHADRSRFMGEVERRHVGLEATLLVDGRVRGLWRIRRGAGGATLHVRLFAPLGGGEEDAVTAEAARLLHFVAPGSGGHDVRFAAVGDG